MVTTASVTSSAAGAAAGAAGAVVGAGRGDGCGGGCGGDGLDAGLVADPADDVGQGGEVAQLEVLVAFDVEPVADGGEHLGLLDGVDAEVGLEVEVQVEQLGRVAGHLGDDGHDGVGDLVGRGGAAAGGGRGGGRCRGCSGCGCGGGGDGLDAGLVADPADDVGQGGEVAQLQVLVAFDVEPVADRGEDLGLLDGVDAEVGLEVEVQVEQLGRVAGHLGDDADHSVGDLVAGGSSDGRCRGGRGCRRDGCGCGGGGDGLDAGLVADPADDVGQGGEVAQLQVLVAFDVEPVADRGEDLGLLDGVDAEVGLEVEVQVQQLGRVAGHLRHDADHSVGDLICGRGGGCSDGGGGSGDCRRPGPQRPVPLRVRPSRAGCRSCRGPSR